MHASKDNKPRQIEIVVSAAPTFRSFYANSFSVELEGSNIIIYFAFQSDKTAVSTKVEAVCISIHDILNQVKSFESYIQKIADVASQERFGKPIRGIFAVEKIDSANIIQLSRIGDTAEIAFAVTVIHDVVLWKTGQPTIEAHRNLIIRCSVHLQIDLLFKILEIVNEAKK